MKPIRLKMVAVLLGILFSLTSAQAAFASSANLKGLKFCFASVVVHGDDKIYNLDKMKATFMFEIMPKLRAYQIPTYECTASNPLELELSVDLDYWESKKMSIYTYKLNVYHNKAFPETISIYNIGGYGVYGYSLDEFTEKLKSLLSELIDEFALDYAKANQ